MESFGLIGIPGAVLAGAAVNGGIALWRAHRKESPETVVTWVGCLAPILSFILSLRALFDLWAAGEPLTLDLGPWLSVGGLDITLGLRVDPLSAVMLLVVTGVGSLIHIYSMGYMHRDPAYARFYACLNLFLFFMTVLVLADHLVLLFLGWEGVGLTSYLLIAFWWSDAEKADCGKKAFIVNRVGDWGFLLGLFTLFSVFGTLALHGSGGLDPGLADQVDAVSWKLDTPLESGVFEGWSYRGVLTLAGILLFLGACGKSAQIPLHVWLPDAMAGPTPVSALIHAATMVTAGVYLVARMGFLYSLAPGAQMVVASVGTATALFAASQALVQNDIKKILAYSTISQLGFMFLAVGLGAYSAGVFHLVTHAFFKACLFLGAGSVIHAMHHEQDIRNMGGLRTFLPHTYWTFVVAALALAGVFPLSGFFSKDAVLIEAFTSPGFPVLGKVFWGVGMATAAMTAFYMFRLIFIVFHGEPRMGREVQRQLHESPFSMVSMLWVLALGSVIVGLWGVPHWNPFGQFLDLAVASAEAHPGLIIEIGLALLSLAWVVAWILVARDFYLEDRSRPEQFAAEYPAAYRVLTARFHVDDIYEGGIVQPIFAASRGFLYRVVDSQMIDGMANGLALLVRLAGELLRLLQTGMVRTYLFVLVAGTAAVLWFLIFH